jgi:hypothetical protein
MKQRREVGFKRTGVELPSSSLYGCSVFLSSVGGSIIGCGPNGQTGAGHGVLWSLVQIAPEHRQSIIEWAEGLSKVNAVFLLGRQAQGTADPGSDIELGLFLGGADSWWDLLTFLNHRRAWRTRLEKKLLGLSVHLELMNHEPAATGTEAAHVALWRRAVPVDSADGQDGPTQ